MKQARINFPTPVPVLASLKSLGERISEARRARSITQGDLARKADVGINTLVKMEQGAETVQIGAWCKVLHALELLDALDDVARLTDDAVGLGAMRRSLPRRVRAAGRSEATELME